MKKYLFILLTSALILVNLSAQESVQLCGYESMQDFMQSHDPHFLSKQTTLEKKHLKNVSSAPSLFSLDEVVIPIVIHVIHNNGAENISDEQVMQGIDDLNNAFRNVDPYNPEIGANTHIQFCLAQQDEQGNSTSGIIRHESWLTDMSLHHSHELISELATWNAKDYLNIRLVKTACLGNSCVINGYSTTPESAGSVYDGVVMRADKFGTSPANSSTTVHEVGHYLGLLHTFHGACKNDDCLVDGDKICDTPPENLNGAFACFASFNSCSSDSDDLSLNNPFRPIVNGGLGDQEDLQTNYMDYADKDCSTMFTEGQSERMHFFIDEVRSSLLNSEACVPGCEDPISVYFTTVTDSIITGESLLFTNLSDNGTSYKWYINNQWVSDDFDLNEQFNTEGVYTIRLEAYNLDSPDCVFGSYSINISVLCTIDLDFSYLLQNDTLYFQDLSTNTSSIEWKILENNIPLFASSSPTDYFSTASYSYLQVCLIGSNDYCADSLCQFINVSISDTEICFNEVDDDGDGLIDLYDPDCSCTDSLFQAQCPVNCEYLPDSFPDISMQLKWQTVEINDYIDVPIHNFAIGDIDNDGIVEVVANQRKGLVNNANIENNVAVISGLNGNTLDAFLFRMDTIHRVARISLLDINHDGEIEVFTANYDTLFCYSNTGSLIWATYIKHRVWKEVNFADFNHDGIPEVYSRTTILNAVTGDILLEAGEGGCNKKIPNNFTPCSYNHTLAGDFTTSPNMELAAGNVVYEIEINNTTGIIGNTMTPIVADYPVTDGFTSMGDIDGDGELDVITVRDEGYTDGGGIWVWNPRTQALIAGAPSGKYGGIASIGDVDGDCVLEISVVFVDELRTYQYDGTADLKLLYSISVDDNEGFAGVSMFDFNQDGRNEIVYKDDNGVYIIEGSTGIELTSFPLDSRFAPFPPYIADVDKDGQADILVSGRVSGEPRYRIFCLESAGAPWAPARSVWNQAGYHSTNVNDDLTCPRYQQNMAQPLEGYENCLQETCSTPYNTFMGQSTYRTQAGCVQFPAVDLMIDIVEHECTPDSLIFYIVIDNLSEQEVEVDCIGIACYYDNPFTDDPEELNVPLELTGWCLERDTITNRLIYRDTIRIAGALPSLDITSMFFTINDVGTGISISNYGETGIRECDYTNNVDSVFFDLSTLELDLGPDYTKCESEVITLHAGPGFDYYSWNDGTMDSIYSSSFEGLHYVEARDQCNRVYRDTVELIIEEMNEVALGVDLMVCPESAVPLSVTGDYDFIQWLPSGNVDCVNCSTVSASTDTSLTLIVIVGKENCYSTDSILIEVKPYVYYEQDRVICEGDTLFINDSTFTTTGYYEFNTNQCDSIIQLDLVVTDEIVKLDTIMVCAGDSIFVFDDWIDAEILVDHTFSSVTDCDSTQFIQVLMEDLPTKSVFTELCTGDSVLIGDTWLYDEGLYSVKVSADMGCDSLISVELVEIQIEESESDLHVCEGDSIFLSEQWIHEETTISEEYTAITGCDSIHYFHVLVDESPRYSKDHELCLGDSILIANQWVVEEGGYNIRVEVEGSCDSIYEGNLTFLTTDNGSSAIELCPGDSILIGGAWRKEEGAFSEILTALNGCDSLHNYEVTFLTTPEEPEYEVDCEALQIVAYIDASLPWQILWDNGDTTQQTFYNQVDMASVQLTTDEDCVIDFTLEFPLLPSVDQLINIGDTSIKAETDFTIELPLDQNVWKVIWSPSHLVSCDTCMTTSISIEHDEIVEIHYIHESGCSFTNRFRISLKEPAIYVPNIFSPNGDEINDEWHVFTASESTKILECRIYDRWGNEVGEWLNTNEINWNGEMNGNLLMGGVYVYMLKYEDSKGEVVVLKGDMLLVR